MMNKEASKETDKFLLAKETAFRFLSYRPRSVNEVCKKLAQKGFSSEVINRVITILEDQRLVDDHEFASMWLRSRMADKPSGRIKLYFELIQKGIDKEIIGLALEKLSPETEENMAALLVRNKINRGVSDYKKLERFLLRRGFNQELVKKVLRQAAQEV